MDKSTYILGDAFHALYVIYSTYYQVIFFIKKLSSYKYNLLQFH